MAVVADKLERGALCAAISNAVVHLVREYTGRGPTKARTTIDHDVVVVMMSDTMTKPERHLAEKGKGDLVAEVRREFQQSMREDLVRVVGELTGRQVDAFMSANHVDPDMSCEVFALAPAETVDDPLRAGAEIAT
jgi:uncharacterized protein YbcI